MTARHYGVPDPRAPEDVPAPVACAWVCDPVPGVDPWGLAQSA